MADGMRFRTIETQIQLLTATINTQIQVQLNNLTEKVANHSHSITNTSTVLQRMETLLQSLTDNAGHPWSYPERLTIASVHFDQSVIPCYQMLQRAQPFLSWQELSRSIELERPRASLFKLSQTGSLDDYYLELTALANRSTGLTAEALLDCFISGLQKELQ
ncbi:hypothetical protein L195_g057387, partial [Trifolium pratense]